MINYDLLSQAVKHYTNNGFEYIETPWIVSEYSNRVTTGIINNEYKFKNNLELVGSGEQSFIELYINGLLPRGTYQTITPCFRTEIFYTLDRKKYFIKNELIDTKNVDDNRLNEIVNICYNFFSTYVKCDVIETIDGFDIVTKNNVELGSYGIRKTNFLDWIYATGCAEPRLSNQI